MNEANQPQRIRVLVAEDNRDLCDAICALISAEPDMEIVGDVALPKRLPDAVRSGRAGVVVLDLNLSGESSVGTMQAVRRELPRIGVVVYSGYDRSDLGAELPGLGNCEYVAKTGDPIELLAAIRRAAKEAASAGN